MKVWILQTGEPLHCDGGDPRPMRAMNLADALVSRGHEVVIWSSAFYHQEKRSRSVRYQEIVVSERLAIRLVPSPGYSQNIGPGRLFDHFVLGRNLKRALESRGSERPDVIFVGFPPIETASVMVKFAVDHGVPVVVDAKDQWPDIFVEPLPAALRPLVRLLLWPYFRSVRRTFGRASAFCSMSDEFIDWMCMVAGRSRRPEDFPAALTAPERRFPDGELQDARAWWSARGVDLGHAKRAVFIGSFSAAFDFAVIAALARAALADGNPCQFVICGDGGDSASARGLLAGLPNVVMPGWIDSPKIKVLYESSSALIAPYRSNDAFSRSIPNKITDALSFGCAIIATLDGKTRDLVSSARVGRCSDDVPMLYDELAKILGDDAYRSSMQSRARDLYAERFRFDVVYGALVDRLVSLATR
jgi:glycosyltransferase involved in cell wall biosynthesis